MSENKKRKNIDEQDADEKKATQAPVTAQATVAGQAQATVAGQAQAQTQAQAEVSAVARILVGAGVMALGDYL